MGRPKNTPKEMTNQQAYQWLSDNGKHWDRKDKNHIVVFTEGYKTSEAYEIEAIMMKARMYCSSQEFDKICGKTFSTFKHQAK